MRKRPWLIFFCALFFWSLAPGRALAEKDLHIQIEPSAQVVPAGEPVFAEVLVTFNTSADQAWVWFETSGSAVEARGPEVLEGPWGPGDTARFRVSVEVSGTGPGLAVMALEAFGASGLPAAVSKSFLHVEAEGARIWFSAGSRIGLRMFRMQEQNNEAPGAAEETMEDIARAEASTDNAPGLRALVSPAVLLAGAVAGARKPDMAAVTVSGTIAWSDSAGHTHGLPDATVQILDKDAFSNELITQTATDQAGNYTATFSFDDGQDQGWPDLFIRVLARSAFAVVSPPGSEDVYYMDSSVTYEVADGSSIVINLTAGNATEADGAFSVFHALALARAHTAALTGADGPGVTVYYPSDAHPDQNYRGTFTTLDGVTYLLAADKWDWDVILHEYGHLFQRDQGFDAHPAWDAVYPVSGHRISDNLAERHGSKDKGIRLAFCEGWPTYFSLSCQQATGAGALGIPNVGDAKYQDTVDVDTIADLESNEYFVAGEKICDGKGEDNELSVGAALWDLFDANNEGQDQVALGSQTLLDLFKAAAATTIGAAWEAVAAGASGRDKAVLGAVFGQANIAPALLSPADNAGIQSLGALGFQWKKNGAGLAYPLNDFIIMFFSADFSAKVFEKYLGDASAFKPSQQELAAIQAGGMPVRWLVCGRNTAWPATPGGALGYYWSGYRTLAKTSSGSGSGGSGGGGCFISASASSLSGKKPEKGPGRVVSIAVSVFPGKPGAARETIRAWTTGKEAFLKVSRESGGPKTDQVQAGMPLEDWESLVREVRAASLLDFVPEPVGGPVYDFGERSLSFKLDPGQGRPETTLEAAWDRPIKNAKRAGALFGTMAALAWRLTPGVPLYYFHEGKGGP